MNQFFVLDVNTGQKYGPADIATLNQWAQDRRLTPTSMLEDASTGQQIVASAVPGLIFPGMAAATGQPVAGPGTTTGGYSPPNVEQPSMWQNAPTSMGGQYANQGSNYANRVAADEIIKNGWIMFAVGLVCCSPLLIGSIIQANKALALGDERGKVMKILSIIFLVLAVIGIILNIGVFMTAIGSSSRTP